MTAAETIAAGAALVLALSAFAAHAAQQPPGAFPVKPIRLIVPYPPGGGNDAMARAIGARLTETWGQQIIIDNRAGANGILACEITAAALPDGYTLLMANVASHAINPALYRKLPYDPIRDITPVSLLGTTANILVVPSASSATGLAELITLAKAKPGQLTYASNGTGSSQHLSGVMFGSAFGIDLVHVPYKGTGPAVIDVIGGQVSMSFANSLAVMQHVKSGRLRALGVTSLRRMPALPAVPAVAEISPGFSAISWWGIAAPPRTPSAVVDTLNRAIVQALGTASMKEQLDRQGVDAAPTTPAEFSAFIKSELVKWGKVVKDSGARAD